VSEEARAALEQLLGDFPEPVARTTRELLARLTKLVPNAIESCEGGDFGIGTAPGYRGLVFVITPQEDGVRLGLSEGAGLADPDGMLEGAGKRHRFVRLEPGEDLDRPELVELLARSARRRHA
jgi:hypothetical protein